MTDQVYLQKINGNPGFVDGATIHPFASKAALDASGSGWEIGTIANAAGVPYSWSGSAWVAVGGGGASVTDGWRLNGTGPVIKTITEIGIYRPAREGNLIGTLTYIMSYGIGKISVVSPNGDFIGDRNVEVQTTLLTHKSIDGETPLWLFPSGWGIVIHDLYMGNITPTLKVA